ncbi:hypothetical protein HBI56_163330 [Parastagonospora nodorum]|nr:hypothetical protein HBH56_125610 [Parastagonospora nodorum]KAH3956896.1 hypothetical protein HBH51_233920 [Parastagonospora nodorum]KAH3971812.1 hypothetical protein HBH52_154710 [Parastagonospora nodorum]KAH3994465.1 hypothetical protein HBI10_188100 [Parastagonospora nodorum]KAH4022628.1 hypothetical protein HBI09_172120 [Parastagonospora nodorum]
MQRPAEVTKIFPPSLHAIYFHISVKQPHQQARAPQTNTKLQLPSVTLASVGEELPPGTQVLADVLMQNAAPVDFIADAKLLTRASADDGDEPRPGSFHRIDWVVDKPEFGIDGSKLQMLSKGEVETAVCVERDEECDMTQPE